MKPHLIYALLITSLILSSCARQLDPERRKAVQLLTDQSELELAMSPGISKQEAAARAFKKLNHLPEVQAFEKSAQAKSRRAEKFTAIFEDRGGGGGTSIAGALQRLTSTLEGKGGSHGGFPNAGPGKRPEGPGWFFRAEKAWWVHLDNAPPGYPNATWIPVLPNYEYDRNWQRQPARRFADGPGQLTLRKESIDLGNMFKADNSGLEVTGDWKDGRLVRAVKVVGAGELAKQEYNWKAINAGIMGGLAPFAGMGLVAKKGFEEFQKAPSGSGGADGGVPQESSGMNLEASRFATQWKNKTANFIVTWDDGGGLLGINHLTVSDPGSGKKFDFQYSYGIGQSLADKGQSSLVGTMLSIRFDQYGRPERVTNPANGSYFTPDSDGFRVTGRGW